MSRKTAAAEASRRNGAMGGRPKGTGTGRQPRPQIRVTASGLAWLEAVKARECLPSIAATVEYLAENDIERN